MIDIFRSEWTKLRSVRSTVWTLAVTGVILVGIAVLRSITVVNQGAPGGLNGLDVALAGMPFALLVLASTGVLVISGEYRTGMIHTSLQAVPQRLRLLSGKAVVFTAVSLAYTLLIAFAAFFLTQVLLRDTPVAVSLGDPGVLRALVGAALLLTASGLFGLALGALIRHTAGAVVAVIAMTMVAPQLSTLLPGRASDFVTLNAGRRVMDLVHTPGTLGPWQGYAVYLGWIAVTMAVAAVLLQRRDA
ncbi:ABC transporter permease subunit [Thermoactinospora rubra]|uniref:ABC transporter permease subunit n=1 Tax=Thermoactinospora rubra TaxID=1088767 RepID=UPI000A0FAE01|nr:ABC transporter permease subunit [Thermoactinospora rubra]